ncbi:tetratricopeptide repeat protein [Mesorhizobium atlanticum]
MIATVPRVGYRFTGDVERLDGAAHQSEAVETGPSIAVLPFVNLSNEVDQQYFGDGLAEDLITRLARLRWLFVCARNSSFAYGNKAMDVKHIGRELGVRYVLDGSVRRSGKHLRITARASDTQNGRQIWAERYDVEIVDFFVLQDQIAQSVIGAIEPKLYAAEHERFQSRAPGSLDAWGFAIRAMPYIWTWGSSQQLDLAEELLTKAINVDPDYPRANCLLAWALAARVMLGLAEPAVQLPIAQDMAQRAIRGDPEDPWTHFAAGFVHMRHHVVSAKPWQRSLRRLSSIRALPSLTAFLGCAYGYGGMADDGLHHLAIADRLSPRDFTLAGNLSTRGLCHFVANRFSEAAEHENRAVELRPHFGTAWRTLAASAGMAGDHALANKALSHAFAAAALTFHPVGGKIPSYCT